MKEKIYYVPADYPEWLFKEYTGKNRQKAIEDLQRNIRILKFYSNNDFAFKDVHNEELFYQNGKILVEMVQLFEKYRIVYPSKHQFLGDLFEQLLNKGFKQNEGQFFTPMPITRFIWDCLPVEQIVKSSKGGTYPKVIDYACGAGHFLTEAVETINYFVQSDGDNSWTRDSIYGIEKDYRLARVAKISLFMNGAGEGNIIFGDGLENAPDKGIDNGTFDILVANPPYSVKDFKQHLQLKNNDFTILEKIGLNGGEIETLFVERIGQLLKPKGVAAVILPSSILSNDSASYIEAREQFLKNFYIRAIVSFGSKTFCATGTTTVVMFLEKFNEPPKQIDLARDTVEAIFNGDSLEGWKDQEVFEKYLIQIEIKDVVYRKFLERKYSIDDLSKIDYFNMYLSTFENSSEAKDMQKKKKYQSMSNYDKDLAYLEKFYDYAHSVEREKLFYFALVFEQSTVIVKAPTDNKEQKDFLGYEWSNRKGNEGIQIIKAGGVLYNDKDRMAMETLASVIRNSFIDNFSCLKEEQQKYVSVLSTKDMLDFLRPSFNKAIQFKGSKKFLIKSKYELIFLGNISSVRKGTAITSAEAVEGEYKVIAGGKDYAYMHNSYNRDEHIITISASGANAGFVNYWAEKIFASDCTTIQAKTVMQTKFLYYYLKLIQQQIFDNLQRGSGQPHVYPEDIKHIPVPDINEKIQEMIVDKCQKIDKEFETTRMTIENSRKKIEELFNELDITSMSRGGKISLADSTMFDVSIGKRVLNSQLSDSGAIPVFSANVIEPFGYIDKHLIDDFSIPSVLWGIDGDWMTSYVPENKEFYPTDHCGVLRCKTSAINPRYLSHILEKQGIQMGFSRTFRASIDRIKGITFTVADRSIQDKTIDEILALENKIKEAETRLESLSGKTSEILNSYLI